MATLICLNLQCQCLTHHVALGHVSAWYQGACISTVEAKVCKSHKEIFLANSYETLKH